MKQIINSKDPYKMNWIENENFNWGNLKLPNGIECEVVQDFLENENIKETYTFKNVSDKIIFTSLKDIGIYTTFSDRYESSEICIKKRCHTHIFCGENVSYILALRMGGEAPHLGLMLNKGSLKGYSIERDISKASNDRGVFILHPEQIILNPGETYTLEWTLFWHNGIEDFYNKLENFENYIKVDAENYVVFENEEINIKIKPFFEFNDNNVKITENNRNVNFKIENNMIFINEKPNSLGSKKYNIEINGIKTYVKILVQPKFKELLEKRCQFIIEKQQFLKEGSPLNGAYIIYDNEEQKMHYEFWPDHNAGRERIGMGILLAEYLSKNQNEKMLESLKKYIAYVERELFDPENEEVFHDVNRERHYERLYNYPWVSLFFTKIFKVLKDEKYLNFAYKVLSGFYKRGGSKFYAIQIPFVELTCLLKENNMHDKAENLLNWFKEHGDNIIKNGLLYPSHEVNYEQSIVAPSVQTLLEIYEITKDEKYLKEAKNQLSVLELFNSFSPDYHLYEVSIRHWDGYWFGKRMQYGDTFPHYWSSLNGRAYYKYYQLTNDTKYLDKAEKSLRATLSMFFPDGSASCAMVFPVSVNNNDCHFYDPWASDQDWGLYFALNFYNTIK